MHWEQSSPIGTGRSSAALGDGAMQMLGLIDLMAYADRWSDQDPRLVVLVLNNRDLNQ
jgi:pyruvate dehydrogenase (quinone)